MRIDGHREDFLGVVLANHILIEMTDDFSWSRNLRERLLARAAATALLVEDRLAQIDTLAADVDVTWTLYQGTNVAITFPTERAKGVFLGGPTATAS